LTDSNRTLLYKKNLNILLSMNFEKYLFVLELYSTYWDKKPIVEISLNNEHKIKQEIKDAYNKPTVIQFEHICQNNTNYRLEINRSNKDDSQTVVSNNQITKDQILHIKSISIDHIDLNTLLYKGIYKPQYPQQWLREQINHDIIVPEIIPKCLDLGHNGTWSFEFSAPFYDWWLLECDQNHD